MTSINAYKLLRINTIFTIVILPFVVIPWVLYPFMFGKTLFLYAMTLLTFIPFLSLCIYDADYRTQLKLILRESLSIILVGLFFVDIIASIFGVDLDRSFFGDEERGMGIITQVVLIWWYFVIRTTIITKEHLNNFIKWIALSGVGVSILALLRYVGVILFGVDTGFRVSGTIANSIFFAGATLFYSALAFLAARNARSLKESWIWNIIGIFQLIMIVISKTRGTLVGVIVAIFIGAIIVAFLRKGVARKASIICVITIIFIISFGVLFQKQLNNINFLSRFTSISLKDSTVKTRIAAWKSGISAFKEYPLFGWGVENFAIAFDMHYNPILLEAGYSETHFDRAHNIIVERLATTGVIGLLTYVIVIFIAFLYCVRLIKRDAGTGIIILLAILAYQIHLLLAFETSLTLLLLYVLFAVLANNVRSDTARIQSDKKISVVSVCIISLFIICAFYYVVIVPMQANSALLHALVTAADSSRVKSLPRFELALSFPTFNHEEIRLEYVKNAIRILAQKNIATEEAKTLFKRAEEIAKLNIDNHPRFSHYHFLLGLLYKESSYLDESYRDTALILFDDALRYSPLRQQYHFAKAEIYNERREFEKAYKEYYIAYNDAPNVLLSRWYKSVSLLVLKRNNEALEILIPFAEAQMIPPSEEEQRFLISVLDNAGRSDLSMYYYMVIVERNVLDAKLWAQLAMVFKEHGEFSNAYFSASMSILVDPKFRQEAERFMTTLPSGTKNIPPTRYKLLEYEAKIKEQLKSI